MNRRLFFSSIAALMALGSISCVAQQPAAKVPHVVFVTGDHEYSSEGTMPALAKILERDYGFKTTVLLAHPNENSEENIPGLEKLKDADMAVFFLRWRRLPEEQLRHIETFLKSGKPLVAFRTSTHAFNYPKDHPLAEWNKKFSAEALGGPPGWGGGHFHYGHEASTDVYQAPGVDKSPILKGVPKEFHVTSWLYHVAPDYPPKDATVLLRGKAVNPNKAAIDNPVAWTWKNKFGGNVFMTTLGHPADFEVAAFQRLVINGVHWAAGKPVPEQWKGPHDIKVAYHGIRKTK